MTANSLLTAADNLQPLVDLGLTHLEAQVYAFLLQESPATGYRVAQAIGRPVAGIYKAIEALAAKGAVLTVEDGENRLVRAVPANELLDRMERQFRDNSRAARKALEGLGKPKRDDRVYQVHTRPQLFERIREMLARAEQFVLMTACPQPLAAVRDDLAQVSARGVHVGLKTFEPADVPRAEAVVDPRGLKALENGPGQWIAITVDGGEFLIGLLSPDGEEFHQGIWSASPFLAWWIFTGLSSDFVLAAMRVAMAGGADVNALQSLSARLAPFETPNSLGKQDLNRRYRSTARPRRG